MYKKTFVIFFLIITIILSLCLFGGCDMLTDDEADKRMKQVVEAITNNDEIALKEMFSERALDEATDFDESEDYLFKFFQGHVKSQEYKGKSFSIAKAKGKITKKECYSWYSIDTDEQKYFFILIDYPIDIEHPENEGLYTLKVVKSDDEIIDFSWDDIKKAGIYTSENY